MTSISPWIIKDFFNDTDLKVFKDYRDVLLKEKKRVLLKDITRAQIEEYSAVLNGEKCHRI